jgi:hypothetical protein
MFNLIDIYISIPVSGCVGIDPRAVLCPGAYNAVKLYDCTLPSQKTNAGADPGFQVRGGGLKKNCAERREARNFFGYFV